MIGIILLNGAVCSRWRACTTWSAAPDISLVTNAARLHQNSTSSSDVVPMPYRAASPKSSDSRRRSRAATGRSWAISVSTPGSSYCDVQKNAAEPVASSTIPPRVANSTSARSPTDWAQPQLLCLKWLRPAATAKLPAHDRRARSNSTRSMTIAARVRTSGSTAKSARLNRAMRCSS